MAPIVTYIMPSIRQDFKKSVDFVLSQTLKEIELIFLNRAERSRPAWLSDDRVIWEDARDVSLSRAMNKALEIVSGDLVVFAHDDDWSLPEQADLYARHSEGFDGVVSGRLLADENRAFSNVFLPPKPYTFDYYKRGIQASITAAGFKTEFLREKGIKFNESLDYHWDFAWMYDCFRAGIKFGTVSAPTMIKFKTRDSLALDKNSEKKRCEFEELIEIYGEDEIFRLRLNEYKSGVATAT